MSYKVFLVEDEVVTREGIRDNVDWNNAGFELCGEAPDGELAIPLIEESKPDVLITDIKMPFMDGLQLSRIVRERMPWVKVIILSGHNEFKYAQSAVKLGITEYLLKPVSSQDLLDVLEGLATTLDQEKKEREKLKSLQHTIEDNFVLKRDKFLLKLAMGGSTSVEAIDQSEKFGLDIVAKYFLVILLRIELCSDSQPFNYQDYRLVEQIVSEIIRNNLNVFLTKKDMEELVLLFKGESLEQITQEAEFLAQLIKKEVENRTTCSIVIAMGSPQDRLGKIHHSFAEALVKSKSLVPTSMGSHAELEHVKLLKFDHVAIENYIKFGSIQEFDEFFITTIQPMSEFALKSYLMKHYLFVDIILTANQFVSNVSGEVERLDSKIYEVENILNDINTLEQIKEEMRRIFSTALSIRNSQSNRERVLILQQAKSYVDDHFEDSDLKMSMVAEKFNISPSHFSTIFHREFGITFRDYLGELRINRAKELLSATNIQVSAVAYQSGYNDSHYFNFVFKKKTGLTPQQFRAKSQDFIREE